MNPALPSTARLQAHLQALESGLLERGVPVRLALLAALAGEHVLLIGPPGTAKSELARRLHRAFADARYFERLLTRFSTPEELFGPLSLKALEDDRYERLIDGYLPTAGVAFLDEVFKANSAILNALLTLLNEREFDNGSARLRAPLISLIGASNEAPADDSLLAFHDRFLLRVPVAPVSDAAFAELLQLADGAAMEPPRPIDAGERAALTQAAPSVALDADVLTMLAALRRQCAALDLPVSDRRWRQFVALMKVAAASEGRERLEPLDVWLAPYALAATPAQVDSLQAWVDEHVAEAVAPDLGAFATALEAFERQLQIEQQAPAEDADETAGKLALARAASRDAPADAMLRIVSETLEARQRRRYSPLHVQSRVGQVHELRERLQAAHGQVAQRLRALQARLQGRLWIAPERAAPWCGVHEQALAALQALDDAAAVVEAGFGALAVDDTLDDVPQPIAAG